MGDKNKYLIISALTLWVFIVGWGWKMLSEYENTPGQVDPSPAHWPSASKITRIPGLATLVMFVHPRCPCTRATMSELALIMAHGQKKVRAYVVFVRLKEFPQDWVKTDLWRSAKSIPGVENLIDDLGHEAKIFHAAVSGQTILYDKEGRLVYSGGITSSRGHEGDNDGQEAIISFLTQGIILKTHAPVYGCAVFNGHQEKLSWGMLR